MQKFKKITEVAEALQVSPRTVRRWIAAGQLGAVNLSSASQPRWRITDTQLKTFLRKKRAAA